MEGPDLFIGIDPGKSGGVCAVSHNTSIAYKCPGTVADMTNTMLNICDLGNNPICVIEAVHSMPGQGVKSVFTFGYNYGNWIGIHNEPVVLTYILKLFRQNSYINIFTLE